MQHSLICSYRCVCISPCGGELTVFLNRACFCFDRSCGEAHVSDDCRLQCGLPAPGPWPGYARFSRLTNGCAWNSVSAFATRRRLPNSNQMILDQAAVNA